MAAVDSLFEPFRSRNLSLKNRIVMAPMTRSFSPGGVPGEDVARYYRRRAEGGVGLIITEGTGIDHAAALNDDKVPLFYGAALEGWRRVLAEVHGAGAKIMPQLWHVGGVRQPGTGHFPDARSAMPSGIANDGTTAGEALTETEIADIIAGYARSAGHAKRLGFDGVELHGAHGYLIDQFFWDRTNRRTDQWGGDLVGRTRFAAECVKAVRREVGADFPVLFRFSQWKIGDFTVKLAPDPQSLERFLAPLAAAGVDIFHCSQRRFWEPEFEGADLNLAGWTKELIGLPTITVGSVGLSDEFIKSFGSDEPAAPASIDKLIERLAREEFDLVAVGRMLIADPEWPHKIKAGRLSELKPFSRELLKSLA
jgi:2,4-dienoyl-CoA reductase-like NADH-dependent reductase (Old Yellow Enzyme family)